ncbi:MAG: hypothetical protein HQL64_05945 [Magnetococcales bacterium]|nr:hypothetical protein [Magnetococcales bacterium]
MNATVDCFGILEIYHPEFADEFRNWRDKPAKEIINGLRARFFVSFFRPAELQDHDVVLWQDPNGRVHLSVYQGFMFHIIDRNGLEKTIPLTLGERRFRLRPTHIVRETTP